MQTIGLIGGMSWESTASYYRLINQTIKQQLGGLHSAKIVLISVDFAEIETFQQQGDWQSAAQVLIQAAKSLQAAGADFLLICTNTMHKVATEVAAAVNIRLLHIADATGQQLQKENIQTVGLLGTRFTMSQDFYTKRIKDNFAIDVLVPDAAQQDIIHQIIYQELCLGAVQPASRMRYLQIIDSLTQRGAQGIILGCTEIGLLVKPEHTQAKLFDTTVIHANAAAHQSLN